MDRRKQKIRGGLEKSSNSKFPNAIQQKNAPGGSSSSKSFPESGRKHLQNRPNSTSQSAMNSRHCPKAYYCLEALIALNKKNSYEILKELIKTQKHFSELIESDLEPDQIVVIIAILAKVCSATLSLEKVHIIINLAVKASLADTLEKYVANLQFEDRKNRHKNKLLWDNTDEFFANLADVCDFLMETIRTKACEILPKLLRVVYVSFPTLEEQQSIEVRETTKAKIKNLIETLDLYKEAVVQTKRKNESIVLPPDDFRTLSVYPSCEEILSTKCAFIRKNIIEGGYVNVEHYLDVQFRLLKEDFVAPLRKGIKEYFDQMEDTKLYRKFSDIRIHQDVVFQSPIFENGRVGVILKLSKVSDRIFEPRSKSFNYGSLVCFTKDDFGSVLFGRVLERQDQEKQLIIGFAPEDNNYELNVRYTMVECKIFFEPYYHVLKALQCMSEVDFPMKRYLVDVDSIVEPPDYLNPTSSVFTIQGESVDLFGNNWPPADQLKLNSSQYTAFKAALTQKFVVIQGPPGTGKTYMALEIVKTLLHNDNIEFWYNETPILIVCFTNHALDQFLEGLIPTTKEIVRVGGRSKNENLSEFNLKNIRRFRRDKVNYDFFHTWKGNVESILNKLKEYSDKLQQIKNYNHIIAFKHFARIDENIKTSWFSRASSPELFAWLFADERKNIITDTPNTPEDSSLEDAEESDQPNNDNVIPDDMDRSLNDNFKILPQAKLTILESIPNIERDILKIENALCTRSNTTKQPCDNKLVLEADLADLQKILHNFKARMFDGETELLPMKPHNVNYRSPHLMELNDRWKLYFYWLNLYKHFIVEQLVQLQHRYEEVYKEYTDVRNTLDTKIMKTKLVIGMTTTGAARLQTSLQALKCRIVIVEEAAEVLEPHVTVSLTNHCEHLILIGDHQQLRPSTADYRIEKKFNLGISMFERMVLNKIQCNVLDVQHRMRPEFAQLIVPHIYPELENHYSVTSFPPIVGIDSTLFFIHHEHQENIEGTSKSNLHEAKFLIKLAVYLRKVGYKPQDITILSAYLGQMFVLLDEKQKNEYKDLLKDVRICVLDNYQGEESKIILLSLVRNNHQGKIGFLKTENRVCVALSRAKEGLYIMGNMDLLCQNSEIWRKIKAVLERQNCLGNSLTIRCDNHPDRVTELKELADFYNIPEGGCLQICGRLMDCGHKCSKICHIVNRDHTTRTCTVPCTRECNNGHVCKKLCYEEWGNCKVKMSQSLKCGHIHMISCYVDLEKLNCNILVMATLSCGHEVSNKPCYKDANDWKCNIPCDVRIDSCGHACTFPCHITEDPKHLDEYGCRKRCEKTAFRCSTEDHRCQERCSKKCLPCKVEVKKSFPNCDHTIDEACSTDMTLELCLKSCKKLLPCGHKCTRTCSLPCGGCTEKVQKLSPCGHEVKIACNKTPSTADCRGSCPKKLKCGHPCTKKCNEICTTDCREIVDVNETAPCGHQFKTICNIRSKKSPGDASLSKSCREPCAQILECSHKCSGTCGSCFQGRIHLPCSKKCDVYLTCGHKRNILCRDVRELCEHKCSFKCRHVKYQKGFTKCNAPCARRCKHVRCTARCWEDCTVGPCHEPCDKILKCAHPCIGFCGEPCPKLCRVCNKNQISKLFLGDKEEEDARFVMLDECKHVVESKELEVYFRQGDIVNGVLVDYKRCPRCEIPLMSTHRYNGYIKTNANDSVNIQIKVYGRHYERRTKRHQLEEMLNSLQRKSESIKTIFPPCFPRCMQEYRSILNNQGGSFNLYKGKNIEAKLIIIQRYYEIFNFTSNPVRFNNYPIYRTNRYKHQVGPVRSVSASTVFLNQVTMHWNYLLEFLTLRVPKFTNQTILDIEREMWRFQRMKQIFDITGITTNSDDLREVKALVLKSIPYTNDYDDQVKTKLEKLYKKLGKEVPNMGYRTILQDLNFKQRRWFKCPTGHYFMDCGDPTQITKCAEC